MNAMDLITDNRGADYHKSLENYSLSAWRKAGGVDGAEPYYEEDTELHGMCREPVLRVYVDAALFPEWETWKAEAERAKLGVIKGTNPVGGFTYFGGSGHTLSGNPAFIVEEVCGIGMRLWINVLCPCESEFYRAKHDAAEEAENRSRWAKEHDTAANSLNCRSTQPAPPSIVPRSTSAAAWRSSLTIWGSDDETTSNTFAGDLGILSG